MKHLKRSEFIKMTCDEAMDYISTLEKMVETAVAYRVDDNTYTPQACWGRYLVDPCYLAEHLVAMLGTGESDMAEVLCAIMAYTAKNSVTEPSMGSQFGRRNQNE